MANKLTHLLIILMLAFSTPAINAQVDTLNTDPYRILSGWTYEDVISAYGEGTNIIDTLLGQAYIAGFRYHDNWFNRPCELAFYFTDVNVSRIQLRFIHPNYRELEKKNKEKEALSQETGQAMDLSSDSLWLSRVKENPGLFDSLKTVWREEFIYRKSMLEKDSLIGDSIIRDISFVLGQPLKEGPTPHTDKDSRYMATWIKNGFSCSFKDYKKYAEVNFGISPAPGGVITEFNLDPQTKLIEKTILEIKNQLIEVSLLGIPLYRGSPAFDRLFIHTKPQRGGIFLEEMPYERPGGINPKFNILDLTGDGIPDIWLEYESGEETGYVNNVIYSLELIEPLMVFDPMESLELHLDGELTDDFQAMVMIEGDSPTPLPLDREDKIYADYYDQDGRLLKPAKIGSGSVKSLESRPTGSKGAHQFTAYLPVWTISEQNTIGYVRAVWDYHGGGWVLESLDIRKDGPENQDL